MIYDYNNPDWMEQAHRNGDMPDWIYYQMNGRSPEENLFRQKQAFLEQLKAREAEEQRKAEEKRAEKELEKQIGNQTEKAVEQAIEKALKNLNFGDMKINIKL